MKILLLGAGGQVGRELVRPLSGIGSVFPLTRRHCDFANISALRAILDRENPAMIVNAAAYTAVDGAETERTLADAMNHRLPAVLAQWCAARDALLVDFSTDYIFDGSKHSPWLETDQRAPLNVYGESKLAGLTAIENSGCPFLVFIVTWIYAKEGKNFPNTILRLAADKPELNIVSDQIGAPTPASWIADQVAHCVAQVVADRSKAGLYNLAPSGNTSWCNFARDIITQALEEGRPLALTPADVRPIPSAKYPTPATRPANSLLDTNKLRSTFGILPPHWRSLYRELAHKATGTH